MSTRTKNNLIDYLMIFLAACLSAISLEVFLLPCGAIFGSSTGVAGILDMVLTQLDKSKWYHSSGVWILLINLPILIYCFLHFRKQFALRTSTYILMLSVILVTLRLLNVAEIFNGMINKNQTLDKVIYILVGGAMRGLCLPLVLARNASTGGSDIVGLIVQRNTKKGSSGAMRAIMFVDLAVIAIGTVVKWAFTRQGADAFNLFVYSVAAMFVSEIIQERIYRGFSSAVELEVTTDKPDEMVEALQQELKHGTTTVNVTGGYTRQDKKMILCVINKNQLTLARKVINRVDPNAFAYVENVREVIGKGFANKESELGEDNKKQRN